MKAVSLALELAGAEVSDIVVVIERGEGAEALRATGLDVKTLVSVDAGAGGVTIKSAQ
jgi:adenine phosphoribosyltransferase